MCLSARFSAAKAVGKAQSAARSFAYAVLGNEKKNYPVEHSRLELTSVRKNTPPVTAGMP